jgi:hypothetical protein
MVTPRADATVDPGPDRVAIPMAQFLAVVVTHALIYGVYETATKVADLFG